MENENESKILENEEIEKTEDSEEKNDDFVQNVITQEEFSKIEEKFKKYSNVEEYFRYDFIGTFDDGKYIIDDEVKKELKIINKTIDVEDEKTITCHAKYHELSLNFVVEIEYLSVFSNAKLYLLEEGEEKKDEDSEEKVVKKMKTLISTETTSTDMEIVPHIKQLWHIYREDTQNEVKLSELDRIIIRLFKNRIYGKDLLDILAQLYCFQMIKFLDGLGEIGKEIVKEYNEFIRIMTIKTPTLINNHVRIKRLLDKFLSENELMKEIKLKYSSELSSIYKEFYEPIERLTTKKEKNAEAEKTPKAVENVEMKKEVKKPALKNTKGEKPYYPKPAKPGKFTYKNSANIKGGSATIVKPSEPKKTQTPKQAAPQPSKTPQASPAPKPTQPSTLKTKFDTLGDEVDSIFDKTNGKGGFVKSLDI